MFVMLSRSRENLYFLSEPKGEQTFADVHFPVPDVLLERPGLLRKRCREDDLLHGAIVKHSRRHRSFAVRRDDPVARIGLAPNHTDPVFSNQRRSEHPAVSWVV